MEEEREGEVGLDGREGSGRKEEREIFDEAPRVSLMRHNVLLSSIANSGVPRRYCVQAKDITNGLN